MVCSTFSFISNIFACVCMCPFVCVYLTTTLTQQHRTTQRHQVGFYHVSVWACGCLEWFGFFFLHFYLKITFAPNTELFYMESDF